MGSYQTRGAFRAEVEAISAAQNAIHQVQAHICRQHPLTEREAIVAIRGAHRADAIAKAVDIANHQPCSPFEGL